jgi:hypothetical protein
MKKFSKAHQDVIDKYEVMGWMVYCQYPHAGLTVMAKPSGCITIKGCKSGCVKVLNGSHEPKN